LSQKALADSPIVQSKTLSSQMLHLSAIMRIHSIHPIKNTGKQDQEEKGQEEHNGKN
jgi:hypothetical protein